MLTQVLEFVGLLDRLGRSHTRAAAVLEVQLQRARETYAMANAADVPAVLEACCGQLPLETYSADSEAYRVMRFNADCATNPTWQAPVHGPGMAAVADWWDAARAGAAVGGWAWLEGRRELPKETEARWQQCMTARALVPHVLRSMHLATAAQVRGAFRLCFGFEDFAPSRALLRAGKNEYTKARLERGREPPGACLHCEDGFDEVHHIQ